MAQRYDSQSGDTEDSERARLEQEEMARQLAAAPKPDAPQSPQSSPASPESPLADKPADPIADPAAGAAPDTSKYNTKGYATPGYVASKAGSALSGFDPAKWDDANYQDPKYVFGRILGEASGGTGALKDPAQRDMAVSNIIKAYPGAKFDGKDKITMPDGAIIDIFGGAGSGDYSATFQVQPGTARDPQGNLLPDQGGGGPMMGAPGGGGPSSFQGINGLVPTDTNFYNTLQSKLAEILGGPQALDREELLNRLGAQR